MNHVMVDIETFGTNNDALILSIGAVKFDPNTPANENPIRDKFYVAIDPASAHKFGGVMDPATVLWWMDAERNEARTSLLGSDRVDIVSALEGLAMWFGDKSLPLWGNGSTFDNVILRRAYERLGLETPWKFWHDRCYRTVKSLAPTLKLERSGVFHNAVDDAITQALHLHKVACALSITLD